MRRDVYLLRYYDYDWECGVTCGVFQTLTDVLSYIVEDYEGRVDISRVEEPKPGGFYKFPRTVIDIDGNYEKQFVLERLPLEVPN